MLNSVVWGKRISHLPTCISCFVYTPTLKKRFQKLVRALFSFELSPIYVYIVCSLILNHFLHFYFRYTSVIALNYKIYYNRSTIDLLKLGTHNHSEIITIWRLPRYPWVPLITSWIGDSGTTRIVYQLNIMTFL